MRGWIYVASARGDPDRVRIDHAAVDPRSDGGRAGGPLRYDAVVDAPRDVLRLVHARLSALRDFDGHFRCSPEFAIAAIHHALGGPPPGERIYEENDDERAACARSDALATHARHAERGGSTASFAVPAVAMLAAAVLAAWLAARPMPPGAAAPEDVPLIADLAPATHRAPVIAPALPSITSPVSVAPLATDIAAPSTVGPAGERAAAGPPSAQDCAALEALLVHCAKRRGRDCADGTAAIASRERLVMRDVVRAGRTFDAGALENFCRAACRHGYRPAHADFSATVCRAP